MHRSPCRYFSDAFFASNTRYCDGDLRRRLDHVDIGWRDTITSVTLLEQCTSLPDGCGGQRNRARRTHGRNREDVNAVRQYETLRFVSDSGGQNRKVRTLNILGQHGWRVVGETVEPGHMKGGEACCLATLCLPLGLAAGRTPNVTIVSIERESSDDPGWGASVRDGHEHRMIAFDDNRLFCELCGEQRPEWAGQGELQEYAKRDPGMTVGQFWNDDAPQPEPTASNTENSAVPPPVKQVVQTEEDEMERGERITCPACRSLIPAAATICRYCRTKIEP